VFVVCVCARNVLNFFFQDHIPELYVHFQSQSFHTSMYASSWFLTLFTTALALPTACRYIHLHKITTYIYFIKFFFFRIIDVFLSEGIEIIFKVALALLQLGKDDLLCLDMEGMLRVSNLNVYCLCIVTNILYLHF